MPPAAKSKEVISHSTLHSFLPIRVQVLYPEIKKISLKSICRNKRNAKIRRAKKLSAKNTIKKDMTEVKKKIGNYRYRILALVFMATTINYFDRSIIGVMAPTLQKLFNWSNKDYAVIMVSFKIAYGIGLLFMGALLTSLVLKSATLSQLLYGVYLVCYMLQLDQLLA